LRRSKLRIFLFVVKMADWNPFLRDAVSLCLFVFFLQRQPVQKIIYSNWEN